MSLLTASRRYLILIAGVLGLFATSAAAAEIMIVIDGSGSSAGQIGGVAKIDIARGALRSALRQGPDDLAIGLAAYGHRQRETCSDVEVLAAPGDPQDFLAAVAGVQSIGRSPIAAATEAAAAAFSDPDGVATIIVITDNADNCAPDPCVKISSLKDRMPNLTISVVGIGIPADEIAEIACFARLTGGLYLPAAGAVEFGANLAEALNLAWSDPVPPPPPMPTAAIEFPAGAVQGQAFAVNYRGPLAAGDEIRIAWAGTRATEFIAAAFVHAEGGPLMLTAPAERGAYELRYWHEQRSAILARVPLAIAALEPTIRAPAAVQQGADIVIAWTFDARGGETMVISRPSDGPGLAIASVETIRGEDTVTLGAPRDPGTYELRLVAAPVEGPDRLPPILARRQILVVPAAVTMTASEPVAAGADFFVDWIGPGGSGDQIRLALLGSPEDDVLAVSRPIGDSIVLSAPFPAGLYELRYWSAALGEILAVRTILVTMPEAALIAPDEIGGGVTMEVAWLGPAAFGDRIVILSQKTGDIADMKLSAPLPPSGGPLTIEAPVEPGAYRLAYVTGVDSIALAESILVVTAPVVALHAPDPVAAGERFEVIWQGPDGRFDELRLVGPGASGQIQAVTRLVEGVPAALTAPDEPGGYFIQYWAGSSEVALQSVGIEIVCAGCVETRPVDAFELRLSP